MWPWLLIQLSAGAAGPSATPDAYIVVQADVGTITVTPDVGIIVVTPDVGDIET